MMSEYLLKGIDSLFSRSAAGQPVKPFNRDAIKANLHSVVKYTPKAEKQEGSCEKPNLTKSRLRTILHTNKDNQLECVIRREKSRSISPYQRISPTSTKCRNAENVAEDKIVYYREQRKTF